MSEDNQNVLVDAYGNPIEWKPAFIASREHLTMNIFNYFIKSSDAEPFATEFAEHAITNGLAGEGVYSINILDPDIQQFCIDYGAQKVINTALDENLPEAYMMLLHYAKMPYMNLENQDSQVLTFEDLRNLERAFSNAPELSVAQKVCATQTEISNLLNGNFQKNITSFQASRIQQNFEDLADTLTFEQRAAGYYNISIIHRALLAEKDVYDPGENNAEKECLHKVLEYTSDYKRINYCVNRLQSSIKDRGMVRVAYRRALSATDVPQDLCKINMALAQCYLDDCDSKAGYKGVALQQNDMDVKIERAEQYYRDALKYASGSIEKASILKKIGKIQFRQNHIEDWTETQTQLAMKFYQGEDRSNVLLMVACKNPRLRQEYLEQAFIETKRSRKIKANKKKLLLIKIARQLEDFYTKNNQLEKLAALRQYLPDKTPEGSLSNPLLKYTRRQR